MALGSEPGAALASPWPQKRCGAAGRAGCDPGEALPERGAGPGWAFPLPRDSPVPPGSDQPFAPSIAADLGTALGW